MLELIANTILPTLGVVAIGAASWLISQLVVGPMIEFISLRKLAHETLFFTRYSPATSIGCATPVWSRSTTRRKQQTKSVASSILLNWRHFIPVVNPAEGNSRAA
jgi:hypothetical protein